MNAFQSIRAWARRVVLDGSEDRFEHERSSTLPPVEPLEPRLCLGGVAAGEVADFAGNEASALQVAAPLSDHADFVLLEQEEVTPLEDLATPPEATPVTGEAVEEPDARESGRPSSFGASLLPSALQSPLLTTPPIAAEQLATQPATTAEPPIKPLSFAAGPAPVAAPGPQPLPASSSAAPLAAPASTLAASAPAPPAALAAPTAAAPGGGPAATPLNVAAAQLTAEQVATLLDRASRATNSEDAIIAVVDRNGRILGVRAEADVLTTFAGRDDELVFAIDGAVAKARTAALFSNGENDGDPTTDDSLAPLTSRTVRFISQSTVTEREVNSNPNVDGDSLADALASTVRGPGFVAPVGLGGHFPPEVLFTPPVDLFAIEHTNRDSNLHPGEDGVRGTADDITLRTSGAGPTGETLGRFNIDPAYVQAGQELYAPESYGSAQNSNLLPDAQSRGIATLPGGIPLFRDTDADGVGDTVVGGIGVFFPGPDGFASFEQGLQPGQTEAERTNASRVLEAEFIAFVAAGGSAGATPWFANADVGSIGGVAAIPDIDLPFGRLDLVGITLEVFGPGSSMTGIPALFAQGAATGPGLDASGEIAATPFNNTSGADQTLLFAANGLHRDGLVVPQGFLVTPHTTAATTLTVGDINTIITQAIAAADETRAAVRLPVGSRTKMVFAITDTTGEVLALFRMQNATTFSIDVAVAKARNVSYYADATALQAEDQVPGVAAGTAFTNRTFRFLAEPRFPSGIDGTDPPEFSILNDGTIDPTTAENLAGPDPVSEFTSVLGHDAFFPQTNFRDPGDATVVADGGGPASVANQNGVVFFPGSIPLYKDGVLVGGFGVSGDGVDQDDVVTFLGAEGFRPPGSVVEADEVIVDGVRLPFQKFLRNPFG